ncbi:MAG: hypothetical protein AAGJ37_15590 [Pseudomonadota bacterium]
MKLNTLKLSALFLISATASFTAISGETTGEYKNLCAMGLALEQQIDTDCSINHTIDGKTYCFGNDAAKVLFLEDSSGNLEKAEAYYDSTETK